MASITGTSSSSILTSLSNKRISGLASGMDTDGLIESMTSLTRSKIARVQQQKQLASWKMDSFRSISSKMIALQNKFTSYSSSTNLRSPSFFSKSVITASGENSKYVKATGNGDSAGSVTIAAVTQLAQNTSYVSKNTVSSGTLQGSAEIDPAAELQVSKLAGETIKFEYNNKNFSITLDSTKSYETMEQVAEEINIQLKNQEYSGNTDFKNLSDIVQAKVVGEGENATIQLDYVSKDVRNIGNTFKITSVGQDVTDALGWKKDAQISGKSDSGDVKLIESKKKSEVEAALAQKETKGLKDTLAGKSLTFSYNGKTATIKIPDAEIVEKDKDGKVVSTTTNTDWLDADGNVDMEKLGKCLQKQLDKEFGSGRVTVNMAETAEGGKYTLGFTATNPTTKEEDKTSVLKITGGDSATLTAFGLKEGASNRLNVNASLKDSGFIAQNGMFSDLKTAQEKGTEDAKTDYVVRIRDNISGNIVEISETVDGKKFGADTSMKEIIEAINASDAGVKVTYLETADKLSIESTQPGASGDFAILSSNATIDEQTGEIMNNDKGYNLGTALFGTNLTSYENATQFGYVGTKGQDAEIYVDYDGEGGAEPTLITRSSNTFNLNGMDVTVSGTFGVDENGKVQKGEAVSFESKVDTDKVTEAVKEMITAYNEIVELANKLVSEKRDRDYQPLTDEQKEEMSEDEIKKWEEKAKAGMLFNNSELRSFTTDTRFLFSKSAEMIAALEDMGITTANSYSGAGKVNFDENKFKAALESNPEKVKEMFTAAEESYVDEKGNKVVTKQGGLMTGIKSVFDKYSAVDSAVKGIFVQQAGATESPLSMLNNNIQKQMDSYDDMIKTLQDKLEDEAERYYKQFSNMEVYINNMNSQSNWLAQQFAY